LQLSGASSPSGISLTDVLIHDEFFLPRLVDGTTSLVDVTVGGNFVLENGQLQDVNIERLQGRGVSRLEAGRFEGRVTIVDSSFGKSFLAKEASFSGECEFRKVLFPGDDPFAGVVFAKTPKLIDTMLLHEPVAKTGVTVKGAEKNPAAKGPADPVEPDAPEEGDDDPE